MMATLRRLLQFTSSSQPGAGSQESEGGRLPSVLAATTMTTATTPQQVIVSVPKNGRGVKRALADDDDDASAQDVTTVVKAPRSNSSKKKTIPAAAALPRIKKSHKSKVEIARKAEMERIRLQAAEEEEEEEEESLPSRVGSAVPADVRGRRSPRNGNSSPAALESQKDAGAGEKTARPHRRNPPEKITETVLTSHGRVMMRRGYNGRSKLLPASSDGDSPLPEQDPAEDEEETASQKRSKYMTRTSSAATTTSSVVSGPASVSSAEASSSQEGADNVRKPKKKAALETVAEEDDVVIKDVEVRMLPKDESVLTTPKEFELTKDLTAFQTRQEKLKKNLRTGFRTKEQAMSEFKLLRVNERVFGEGENRPKKKKHHNDSDEEEQPCQCVNACDTDCLNRGLQIECSPKLCPVDLKKPGSCQNQRLGKGEKKKTEVRAIEHKGCGLFALERILRGSLVNEYVGEVIDENECARRLADDYVDEKHKYLMCMNGGLLIDATRKGNVARFINHSCNPNCKVQEWQVRGVGRMGIFAIRDIEANEEISFDYNFQRFGEGIQECHCGAVNCRGLLGKNVDNNPTKKKTRLGQDPVLNDNVGRFMDEISARRTENFVLNLLESSVPDADAKRARQEGLFLVRNVNRALNEIYAEGGKIGWKALSRDFV